MAASSSQVGATVGGGGGTVWLDAAGSVSVAAGWRVSVYPNAVATVFSPVVAGGGNWSWSSAVQVEQ